MAQDKRAPDHDPDPAEHEEHPVNPNQLNSELAQVCLWYTV